MRTVSDFDAFLDELAVYSEDGFRIDYIPAHGDYRKMVNIRIFGSDPRDYTGYTFADAFRSMTKEPHVNITVNLAQYARLFLGWLDHTKEDENFLRVLHEATEHPDRTLLVSTDEDVIAQVQAYFEQIATRHGPVAS